jgi:hypothetical protein
MGVLVFQCEQHLRRNACRLYLHGLSESARNLQVIISGLVAVDQISQIWN